MTATWERFLFWAPRVLAILFAAFLGVFAADVFSETSGFWSTAAALLLHLIPSVLVLLILWIARRREWLGGMFYLAFGVIFLVTSWQTADWVGTVVISAPLLAIAFLLFAHGWLLRSSHLPHTSSS